MLSARRLKHISDDLIVSDPKSRGVRLLSAGFRQAVHRLDGAQDVDVGDAAALRVYAGADMRAGEDGHHIKGLSFGLKCAVMFVSLRTSRRG